MHRPETEMKIIKMSRDRDGWGDMQRDIYRQVIGTPEIIKIETFSIQKHPRFNISNN